MTSTITDRSPLPVPELDHDAIAAEALMPDATATPTVISLQDVSFYYGAFRAVKDITFDVHGAPDHRDHRPVRLRQVDAPADRSTG